MVRQWIIRLLFLAPLVCVAGLWVTSYFGCPGSWGFLCGRRWNTGTVNGEVFICYSSNLDMPIRTAHLIFWRHDSTASWGLEPLTWGFGWGPNRNGFGWSFVAVPLWLPTLLLLGLYWFVWRKTRAKYSGRAFPVEPAAKSGESKP